MDWAGVVFAALAAMVLVGAMGGFSGGVSQAVVALAVASAGVAQVREHAAAALSVAAVLLAASVALLARGRSTFRRMRPRRATAVVVAAATGVLLALGQWTSVSSTPHGARCDRVIVPSGGYFRLVRRGYFVTGPHRGATGCAIDVSDAKSSREVPLSTPVVLCNATGVLLCDDTMTVNDAGETSVYGFPSLAPYGGPAARAPRAASWLDLGAFLLAVVGIVVGARRARSPADGGPYRDAPAEHESVAPFGVGPAVLAALVCASPLAVVVARRLLG